MAQGLFRQQAVEKQQVRLYGPVLLRQPVSYLIAFCCLFMFSFFALSLLIFGEFARKESVSGYLVPQAGLLKIKSSRTGFVSQSPVAQGDLVVEDRFPNIDGFNGTPSGYKNVCEDEEHYTKWYVLHAEANAIMKVSASTQSSKGATLYITLSPCRECSKLIFQSGIKRLVYNKEWNTHHDRSST